MATDKKLQEALQLIDKANAEDPNTELFNGTTYAKEVLYSNRMTQRLQVFAPEASEALQISVRSQHICRWEIPRNTYEMNRVGYLTWRKDLKTFHAKKTADILSTVGYDSKIIAEVSFLLEKKQLKKNEGTQTLEDVACLVFLEFYFDPFAEKYSEEKIIDIVQKTWAKMSTKGHDAALKLPFSENSLALITKALEA